MSVKIFVIFGLIATTSAFWRSSFWNEESNEEDSRNVTVLPDLYESELNSTVLPGLYERELNSTDLHGLDLITLAKQLNLTKFLKYVEDAGMTETIRTTKGITVFAPSNEAISKAPFYCEYGSIKDKIQFIVARGEYKRSSFGNDMKLWTLLPNKELRINLYKNRAIITASGLLVGKTDFTADNGIIHIVDQIGNCLIPSGNIVNSVNGCPALKSISAALNATKLFNYVKDSDHMTLFAPSEYSFSKLPESIKSKLFSDKKMLKRVLLYHMIPKTIFTASLEEGMELQTAHGEKLTVTKIESHTGKITINHKYYITERDINAENGVIHGVSDVLLPSDVLSQLPINPTQEF